MQDRQAHLRRVLTPPGTGFREEGTTFLNADQILLLTDREVWITYRLSDPRPFLIKELERQPDNTLQLIDVPLQSAQPLRYSFLKFPEAICPEAFQETGRPPPVSTAKVWTAVERRTITGNADPLYYAWLLLRAELGIQGSDVRGLREGSGW